MKRKYDNIWLGISLAIILTAIAFFAFYFAGQEKFATFHTYISYISFTGMFSSVIAVSALPNLLLFFIFIWTNRYRSARGVLTAVVLFTLIVAILRLS
jgi:hypothetical protein